MWYYIIVDLLLLISTSLTYQINACATLTHVIQRKFFKKQRLGSPRGHLYYCSSSWWSKLSIMVTWRQGCWWIQFSLTFLRRNIASSFKSHKPRLTQFGWCWGRYWRIYHTTMFFRLFYPFDGTRDTSHAFLATVECRGTRFGRAVSTSFHIWDHPARKLENIQSQEVWWAQLASILSCSYWSNRVFRSSCGAVEKKHSGYRWFAVFHLVLKNAGKGGDHLTTIQIAPCMQYFWKPPKRGKKSAWNPSKEAI